MAHLYGQWYDALFLVMILAPLALALFRWRRLRFSRTSVGVVWFAMIILLPVVGPMIFLVASLTMRPTSEPTDGSSAGAV